MASTLPVLRRIVTAWVHGVVAVPMGLEYRVADPLAIQVTLGACTCHSVTWHVARSVIAAGLTPSDEIIDCADEWAAAVLVLRLPGSESVLMGLRSATHRVLLTVAATELSDFLARSYVACGPHREARLVAAELDAQCGFFSLTQGGDPA